MYWATAYRMQTQWLQPMFGTCTSWERAAETDSWPNYFPAPAGSVYGLASEAFKLVLIDSPPIGIVADLNLIDAGCNGSLIVVEFSQNNAAGP